MGSRSKIKKTWQNRNPSIPKPKIRVNPALTVVLLALLVAGANLFLFGGGKPYADNSLAARMLAANPELNPKLAGILSQSGSLARQEEDEDGRQGKVAGAFISVATAQAAELQDQETGERKPFEYEVQGGDTLSNIAERYNLKLDTILWANSLSAKSIIRPGQKILLLPVDGVLYTVKKGDTVSKIAALHESDSQKIMDYNSIGDPTKIHAGDAIIIPDGKPLPQAPAPSKPSTGIAGNGSLPPSSAESPASGKLLWPTTTKNLTQKYSASHRGLDIANGGQPPIYASLSGTVEFAGTDGDWGNTILIRGGNGLVTRYSHNAENYVKTGDSVQAGDTIAKVGNTGNVRGKTGLHVDFRVYKKGVAVNPMTYY